MNAVVMLEWKFSPRDYFEEVIEIPGQDFTITIADGQALATIDSVIYEANPGMHQMLHDALNDRFLGVQLLTHRAYKLSHSTTTRVHADGHRDYFIKLGPARFVVSGGTMDFRVADKDGNVIADSKRDRIMRKKSLAELVATHRPKDALLASLLQSYGAAVHDPNNEFVHLYEIRDALSTKFGGENATRAALGISSSMWRRFGRLCCDEPLRQGRHRGQADGALRDATEGELTEARGIARAMIEGYLRHLEASTNENRQ